MSETDTVHAMNSIFFTSDIYKKIEEKDALQRTDPFVKLYQNLFFNVCSGVNA